MGNSRTLTRPQAVQIHDIAGVDGVYGAGVEVNQRIVLEEGHIAGVLKNLRVAVVFVQ